MTAVGDEEVLVAQGHHMAPGPFIRMVRPPGRSVGSGFLVERLTPDYPVGQRDQQVVALDGHGPAQQGGPMVETSSRDWTFHPGKRVPPDRNGPSHVRPPVHASDGVGRTPVGCQHQGRDAGARRQGAGEHLPAGPPRAVERVQWLAGVEEESRPGRVQGQHFAADEQGVALAHEAELPLPVDRALVGCHGRCQAIALGQGLRYREDSAAVGGNLAPVQRQPHGRRLAPDGRQPLAELVEVQQLQRAVGQHPEVVFGGVDHLGPDGLTALAAGSQFLLVLEEERLILVANLVDAETRVKVPASVTCSSRSQSWCGENQDQPGTRSSSGISAALAVGGMGKVNTHNCMALRPSVWLRTR